MVDESNPGPVKGFWQVLFLPILTIVYLLGRFLRRGSASAAPPQINLERLRTENQRLQEETQQLQGQLNELETRLAEQGNLRVRAGNFYRRILLPHWRRVLLVAVYLVLSGIPVLLVARERWLNDLNVRDSLRSAWCSVDLLCHTYLPSYFLLVFIYVLLTLLLFLIFARRHEQVLDPPGGAPLSAPSDGIVGASQKRTGQVLTGIGLAGAVLLLILGLAVGHIPGGEMALLILAFLAGQYLQEIPLPSIGRTLLKPPAWLLALGLMQLALIFLLQDMAWQSTSTWLAVLLGLAAFLNLLRYRHSLSPWVWVFLAAQFIYTWQINSWRFSVIGDEYSFYSVARILLDQQNWLEVFANLFSAKGVYGTHPYFSTVIQAFFMAFLGQDSFGWRFSSLFMAAASIPFFYFFLRRFCSQPAALLVAVFLAVSHYLMTFGKIGYNNLQALFVMGLVLWSGGRAALNRRALDYSLAGACLGLCFYVYPAALYLLPLPFLLFLLYDPPRSRLALGRWIQCLAVLTLFLLPLLFQPDYWHAKIAGTIFFNQDLMDQGKLLFHLGANLIYAPFTYLYAPEETHFVVSSYVDPLMAVFIPLGFAWALKLAPRRKFHVFMILSFLFLLLVVGVTHDRMTPSATRMFLLLPYFMFFGALGMLWLVEELRSWGAPAWFSRGLLLVLVVALIGLNLYQGITLSRIRTTGTPNLEVLYLRLLQRDQALGEKAAFHSYLFISEPNWGIDGIRQLRDVYNLPASQAQLNLLILQTADFSAQDRGKIQDEQTLVIVEPWMQEDLRKQVEDKLTEMGKLPCEVRDAPPTPVQFTLWLSPSQSWLCPVGGEWRLASEFD